MSDESKKVVTLSESEVESLVEKAVLHTLERFGINTDEPIQVQRDFQFVRDWRMSAESVRKKATTTAIAILVSGALAALWLGFKAILVK